MQKNQPWIAWSLSALLGLGVAASRALAADEPQTLAPVQVTAMKDAEAFSIPRSLELIRTFEAIPAEQRTRIRLSFYVQMRSGEPLPADLKVNLAVGDDERPLTLLHSGELVLPPLSDEDAKTAAISANVRKGTIKITYYVQPRLGTTPLPLGTLRDAMKQARPAWAKLYGPVLGWSVPTFTCVRAYYAQPSVVTLRAPDQSVVWQSEPPSRVITLPLDRGDEEDDLAVDWGAAPPGRVGGCVNERRSGTDP